MKILFGVYTKKKHILMGLFVRGNKIHIYIYGKVTSTHLAVNKQ
jgi:hypothetical protein